MTAIDQDGRAVASSYVGAQTHLNVTAVGVDGGKKKTKNINNWVFSSGELVQVQTIVGEAFFITYKLFDKHRWVT